MNDPSHTHRHVTLDNYTLADDQIAGYETMPAVSDVPPPIARKNWSLACVRDNSGFAVLLPGLLGVNKSAFRGILIRWKVKCGAR